jgi:aminoglycoside phosphotransferase (APT) family kinase protein
MQFVAQGEVHHNNAVNSYLVHRYLLERAPAFSRLEQSDTPQYYLKHMDDKGDHILIDDDYNITGIIDWEWAQTMPKG